ncbi:MAG: serine/threonine-protein kinase, partial [Chloroflexota bacterium]
MRTASIEITRRYWLQDKLGEGGMGEVYAAYDRLTGTKVALKRVLHAPQELVFSTRFAQEDTEDTAVDLQRVLANEFRVLASLRHPHIISVLDYGFDSDHYSYYTMSLINTPMTITDAARSFTVPESIQAFAQMLQALAYLHRRDILHRDLKPGNVLIDERNAVKLLDFGLASQDSVRSTTGTLAYMPPEMIQQGQATPQSDLYSLGMVAYELFAGQYPFSQKNTNELLDQLLKQMPDMQPIPVKIRPIITRLLMKNPADRYADAEAALADLAEMSGGAITVEDASVRESFLQAARFIGRERELSLLTDRLDQIISAAQTSEATAGAGYLIGGESGVGKSRLLDELRTHALLNGALVLRGQCLAESGQPFQMWRDVVRRLLLESDVSDAEVAVLREIVPDIPDLLSREVATVPGLGTVATQSRLIDTILGLFQRQTQPIVLILEDLQWGGESLAPLRRLLALCGSLPLLIVGSYRNEEAPTLPNQMPEMVTLTLGRLTIEEIADLSRAMIGLGGAQQSLVDYLH